MNNKIKEEFKVKTINTSFLQLEIFAVGMVLLVSIFYFLTKGV